MRNATLTILPVLGFCCLVTSASAEEMLPNGKFDTSIQTWGTCCGPTGTVGFDPTRDASGSALSGSAEIVHTQVIDASPTYMTIVRCLSAQAGQAFFFGAKVRFREGQVINGNAFVSIEFRPDDACEELSTFGDLDVVEAKNVARGTWIPLTIGNQSTGIVAPAGTNSMRLAVTLGKFVDGTLTLNIDDVFAAPVGTPVCDGFPATMIGTSANDFLPGSTASDVIVGRGGVDWIDGKGGNDRLCGGPGGDTLYGGTGDDRAFGEGGADDVYGGAGKDWLSGGGSNDDLFGGPGVDSMNGGSGTDKCDGGSGAVDLAKNCETTVAVP